MKEKKRLIIATIGPSSSNLPVLINMKKLGMNIARINTKHASKKEIRENSKKIKNINCDLLIDIKNKEYLDLVKEIKPDYVAISFASSAKKIKRIKEFTQVKVISKIESKKGIKNVRDLIKVSDGIMVARGDLGKNISYSKVPIFQKLIIKECLKNNKMVITATEMLLSIMKFKSPEGSEVSDIANAVLDGSDALMLSEETAIGKYPSLAVKIMRKIINDTIKFKGKKL